MGETGLAPINYTNKVAVPERAVKASRSLQASASALTNKAQAASSLHCTGKATPSAYLAKNDPPLLLPASAQSMQQPVAMAYNKNHGSCSSMAAKAGGAEPVAHLLHREASNKWPLATWHMSHRPASIKNNRHATQQQQQQQQFQIQRTGLSDRTTPCFGVPLGLSTSPSLDALRQRRAGSGYGPVAQLGQQQALSTKATFSIFSPLAGG